VWRQARSVAVTVLPLPRRPGLTARRELQDAAVPARGRRLDATSSFPPPPSPAPAFYTADAAAAVARPCNGFPHTARTGVLGAGPPRLRGLFFFTTDCLLPVGERPSAVDCGGHLSRRWGLVRVDFGRIRLRWTALPAPVASVAVQSASWGRMFRAPPFSKYSLRR